MARIYADATALAAWPGGSDVPAKDQDLLLRLASLTVDRLLTAYAYPTDESGMPIDTDDAKAMSDATCAIVVAMHAAGGVNADTRQWSSVSIGSLSLSGPLEGAVVVDGVPVPQIVVTLLRDVGSRRVWSWI